MAERTLAPIRTCNGCGIATTEYTEHDVLGVTHHVCSDCEHMTEPVRDAVRNLRVCRGYMLGCAGALDTAGKSEAVHSLRLSLTTLDDCLDALEPPEQPTRVIPIRGDSIADDRRDDLMMDGDHSDPDRGEV